MSPRNDRLPHFDRLSAGKTSQKQKVLYLVGKTSIEDWTNKTNVSFNSTKIMNKKRNGKERWFILLFCLYFQVAFSYGSDIGRKKKEERCKTFYTLNIECDSSFVGMTKIQQNITGTVRDASGVLTGVTVSIKGKPISTITNENGQFTIAAAEGDVLVFSFIGYTSISMTITIANFNGNALNISMQEDATTLKEVVVNAGYYNVKEKERTGSISKIT